MKSFDFNGRYRIAEYGGVAWYAVGYELVRGEDYEGSGIEEENRDRVRAIMVGDDRVFIFDIDDLEPIKDGDYCPECGQIGCTAYALAED